MGLLAFAAGGVLIALVVMNQLLGAEGDGSAFGGTSPTPGVVVGQVGGEVVSTASADESATPEASPTAPATPTVAPSPTPAAQPPLVTGPPPATPVPATPVPVTPAPPPPPPPTAPPATPAPTPVVAVAGAPADAVSAFYGNVAAGGFDAAYALWSDRMRATYPRQGNLDDRFAQTAAIEFHQLETVSNDGRSAVVQANFTEFYDSGASRTFIGYWELVNVDGAWLLDAPHY